jgi:predicted GIY-YIG superfamily endonuclease
MVYVYLLRSQSSPAQIYTGFTENLRQRLAEHNAGKSPHTAQYRPWHLETYQAFFDRLQAHAFERYLKTASGIAFANKRLRKSSPHQVGEELILRSSSEEGSSKRKGQAG